MPHAHPAVLRAFANASASVLLTLTACHADGPAQDGSTADASADVARDGSPSSSALPLDCRQPANFTDPHCDNPSNVAPGSVGTGIRFDGPVSSPSIRKGFSDVGRIVVTVGRNGDGTTPSLGAVIAVDLATGNRTLISGAWEDPSSGPVHRGAGPDMGALNDVQHSDDALFAIAQDRRIYRIDPDSGDRTLYWDQTGSTAPCMAGTTRLSFNPGSLAVGGDGTVYVSVDSMTGGNGIAAMYISTCSLFAWSGGSAETNRGTGPDYAQDDLDALRIMNGGLWAFARGQVSLMRFDLATGNWTRVSSPAHQVGGGDALLGIEDMATVLGHVITTGHDAGDLVLTAVDPASGNRVNVKPASNSGPASVVTWETAPAWLDLPAPLMVVAWSNSLMLVDPLTGDSNLLSR